MELRAEELLEGEVEVSTEMLKVLKERRGRGLLPFTISSGKSAVELVREGRVKGSGHIYSPSIGLSNDSLK